MKQVIKKISFVVLASALIAPVAGWAQKDKEEKSKDKKDSEQIIITRTGDKAEKVVIELNGDKVTVNGKEVTGKDGDVRVIRNKIKDVWAFGGNADGFSHNWNDNFSFFDVDEDRAMLGVTTETDNKGAEIQTITKDGGAEKAGLKKGDIITKIDDKKIESADDLTKAIRSHKPGDKVSVSYIRDGKDQKVTAELGKWRGAKVYAPAQGYRYSMPNMDLENLPGMQSLPRIRGTVAWAGGGPRLGLSIQDTEDGKGVKVVGVHEDGNASKAGVKEDDVITEVDGKAVSSTDDVAKLVKEGKEKGGVKLKVNRGGKTENIEVKLPKKLKKTDL